MASTATGCLAEKSSADVIIQIAKPVLRQKKLFLVTKRVFDIVCSFLGLLILAIPMMIIALIITIDSPGAPIFKQERLGINGKPFMIYRFAEAVYYCYQNSLLRGRSEMSFDPDAAMTRAELVTVLWRIAGSPNSDNVGKTPFTDVPAGSWYTAAVNWCSENKIVNGIGDGLFAPDDQITREQIVTILYRFAKFRGLDVGDTTDLAKKFTDAARVSDYAKEALSWAVAVGIINGMPDNTIAPQNSATRAEVATIIMRYTKLVSGTEN